MASSTSFLCFLSLLSLLLPSISPSPTSITIPLSQFNTNPSSDLYQNLTHLASISLARAHHLKNPQKAPVFTTSVSSHSYGGYSISLSFGSPPQTIPFIVDTASNFVWFPCTTRYICKNCSVSDSNPPIIPSFIPKLSSSVKILGCLNPKCGWIHNNTDSQSRCPDCEPNSRNCTQICPPYLILYGLGSTGGIALVETLNFPGRKVQDFLVGCSLFSSHQPAGIAGFGRGLSSLPTQLGVKKFSYCLLSHKFDDTKKISSLVLDSESDSGKKTRDLSYTPLIKNPVVPGKHAFSVYYYVGLRQITVGGHKVKIPYKYLSPDSVGNGGTIIDSGTTFTYLSSNVFELVIKSFTGQMKNYKRAEDVEFQTGLRPCFNFSSQNSVAFPAVRFHFKGGAEMALPLENYFSVVGGVDAMCLTVVTDNVVEGASGGGGGPAIILGNYQMQNFYVEYDLRNERLGFRPQSCK
ncbi:unnamed protein product [Ilex paraguariensis]|uniref:Peptidase A1 domain-containing protein n=1 Tax=Ilex paraguariensis TaxID=185542 RepID=A0ABC8UVE1_9AQUA